MNYVAQTTYNMAYNNLLKLMDTNKSFILQRTYNRHLMYTMAAETFEHTSFFCANINLELYFAPC